MNEYKFISIFKTFVDEINLSNSRNYKKEVLTKYKDNDCIKYFLQLVYDPFIVFGISEKKLNKDVGHQSGTLWLDYPEDSEIFEYLKIHNTGTDKDIWTVQQFKKSQICDTCKDLFDKIITKNLVLGISSDTINSVFSETLCKQFKVQLAEKFFDQKDNFLEGKTFALTTKIDGMRCIMMKENGNITFWSRQGQPIEGLVDLEEDIKNIEFDNFIFDGELIAKVEAKEETYKQTMKTARTKDAVKHGLKMMVFDYMSVQDFKNQNCDLDYTDRQVLLEDIFNRSSLNFFEKLPLLYCGKDTNKIIELLTSETAKGEEGIMINDVLAKYCFGRTNSLLKVKKFQDTEVKIIGFEAGINKLSNTLGTLICEYKGNELGVGSGFTDEERNYIWNHQEEYLGQYAKVKYFEETKNADGKESLRFPIYLGIRLEGDK